MRPVALLVVPPGTHRVEPLVDAVQRWNPEWTVRTAWAGDPHLRPVVTGDLSWIDESGESSFERQYELVSRAPLDAVWLRAIRVARALLTDGAPSVVVLIAGAVAVLGPLDALLPRAACALAVPRLSEPTGSDGLVPGEEEMMAAGSWSTSVMGLSVGALPLLSWLHERIMKGSSDGCVGRVVDRAVAAFSVERCGDPAVGVGEWRWEVDDPVLLDLPNFSTFEPWTLNQHTTDRARIDVVGHPKRLDALERALPQLAGESISVMAPGGLLIDDTVRAIAAGHGGVVPPAWSSPKEFRSWLEPRYWPGLRERRRDVAAMFPDVSGRDAAGFRTWCRRSFIDDRTAAVIGVPAREDVAWRVAETLDPLGVNIVGYMTKEMSLGHVARQIRGALVAGGISHSVCDYQRANSPSLVSEELQSGSIEFLKSIIVVNADQFTFLALDHSELFAAGSKLIGYWFWELEDIPNHMRTAASMVDEIWVGSTFVARAFRRVTDNPVRHVPIAMVEPASSPRDRESFPQLTKYGDRMIFAVVFDYFSVSERKNPVGAIEAFKRAFSEGEGPVLVVKSMNASKRWPQHQRVVAAAEARSDIAFWDEHLDRPDHMAFIREVDCLISLHRSEGLGLHLAEAMWLGTPVIATRYSGNLDFMDDESAVLINATLVPVERGEGVYPPEARWAEPDLDQAVAALRTLAADPALHVRLAAKARERMEQQPTPAQTGRLIAELLGIDVAS